MQHPYSPSEKRQLSEHVNHYFGTSLYLQDIDCGDNRSVKLLVVKPTRQANFYTLHTEGLYLELDEEDDAGGKPTTTELVFYLPHDWAPYSDWGMDSGNWPIKLMTAMVRSLREIGSVSHGFIFDNVVPLGNNTQQSAATLLKHINPDMGICQLETRRCEYLQILTIYPEETEFMHGLKSDSLLELIDSDIEVIQVSPLNLTRKNVCSPYNKDFIKIKEHDLLTNWDDAPNCYASDKIMVEGAPIGYAYRMRPDESATLDWDSGWRFLAEGELPEDFEITSEKATFLLNTICNINPDIMSFLHAPYGSAYRLKEGIFTFEPGPKNEPCKTFLTGDELDTLNGMIGQERTDFSAMRDFLQDIVHKRMDNGYTVDDIVEDLEFTLWYSFANNNLEQYLLNFETTQMMKRSEKNAFGCGRWFYRYSCALTCCGELEEALKYALLGIAHENSYPWNRLQAAKLEAHFGSKEKALSLVKEGLTLLPGNYEFETLEREIERGASLEEMEFHVIDPHCDQQLHDGELPEDYRHKKEMLRYLVTDQKKVEQILAMFSPHSNWTPNNPFSVLDWNIQGKDITMIFAMNTAVMSKLDLGKLWELREKLDCGHLMTHADKNGIVRELTRVAISPEQEIVLGYGEIGEEQTDDIPLVL